MFTYLIVIRCDNHDIPVGIAASLQHALGQARQLAHDLKENYTLLRTYARKTRCENAHDPICVSVYQFDFDEIRGLVGSYFISQPEPNPNCRASQRDTIPMAACG